MALLMPSHSRTVSRARAASILFGVAVLLLGGVPAVAQPATSGAAAPALTLEEQEAFLAKARIGRVRGAGKGVTGTLRATLSDGGITHDASIQTIDEFKAVFQADRGTEFNFRDSWRYNVAAYRLGRLLGLDMIPPSIERNYRGKPGSFTWWVKDVLMDEAERLKTKTSAPDATAWNRQMWHVRLFDQLIYNVDRNLGNLLIDRNWTIWMIDHSRSFRVSNDLRSPGNISKCERGLYERLKALNAAALKAAAGRYLTDFEQRALLERRDRIVKLLEETPDAIYDPD